MGDNKLYLLLLLSIVVLSDAQDDSAPCLLAKRFKNFQKYEYLYEAESLNSLNGAINGPRASCKVEIEVPSTCSYVVHTKECTLSEVMHVDESGNPVFGPAAGDDTFKAEMEKNPLKVIVEGDDDIKLFPADDELINILNIKRGIISALAVPVLEEERNKRMPTIYGLCKTEYTVNSREDIATDVTLERDLSRCDHFRPIKDHTSPLAIISGMHYPMAQLIRSKQTCNYKFDNQQKHMTSGVCNENHMLIPFSHKGTFGVNTVSKQMLSLLGVTEYNERVFDHNEANMKPLHLDTSIDMSPFQDKARVLNVLKLLAGLSKTNSREKRAHLAHKLVAEMRKMNTDTLSATLPEALEVSSVLTYQALFQCGTPECSSAMLQVLRTIDSTTGEIDAAVYALGMVPNPSRALVKEMLEMARFKPSKPIYYATSNAVRMLYKVEGKVTPEIQAVADYAADEIGDCTGDQEHIYLTLRVIGNMAAAVGAASPALKSAVIQCISQPAASPEIQQAAIQVFRQTPVPEEGRTVLMQVVLDGAAPVQKRIAAYLIVMKDPQPAELAQLAVALPSEVNMQAKSFFVSHITNILSSTASETRELRQKITDAFQDNEVGEVMNPTKFSRNYKIGSLEGNMIFEDSNRLPKEVILEMTLNAFGYDIDMFEVGMESKGFEPTVEALFGPNGFFPDTVLKAIYYAAEKMPPQVNNVLRNIIPGLRNDRKKRQVPQNIMKEITQSVEKLIEALKSQDAPEAMLYLRLLGVELGYLKTRDVEEIAYNVAKMAQNIQKIMPTDFIKNLFTSTDNEFFLHYIFMDNEFYLPTGPGLPLRVALSGTFAPGVEGGLKFAPDMNEIAFMPSAGVEFVTEFGAHFPDYVQSGLEMHTNAYLECSLRAKLALSPSQIKLSIPAPEGPIKLISVSNSLVSVGTVSQIIPAMKEHVLSEGCTGFLMSGLMYCNVLEYSNAKSNDDSPYFPLTGDSKFEIELRSTQEFPEELTATITFARVEKVDKVTVDLKAEETHLATANMMVNRKTYTVSADLQIPEIGMDVGIKMGTVDPDKKGTATHSFQIDLLNNNVPEASLVGLAKMKSMKDAMLQVQMLIPSLETEAKVTGTLKNTKDMKMELESELKFFQTSSLQKYFLKYDDDKIEAGIKSDVSSETQIIISKLAPIKVEINDLLDQYTGLNEMKIHDMLTASIKVTNDLLEASKVPFIENLRVPALSDIDVPEKLFFNVEAGAKYNFGKQYYTIILPVPLGGKSSRDLSIPSALTTPRLYVPKLGLDIASVEVPLPDIFVPETLTLTLPSLGMAEVDAKLNSNLYNLEATVSAGKDPTVHHSYSTKFKVSGTSPVEILSLRAEGSALLAQMSDVILKAKMSTAVNHKFINARINMVEEIEFEDKIKIKSSSQLEATSPLGVEFTLEYTGQVGANTNEISGDSYLKGSFVTGPVDGTTTLMQSFTLVPFSPMAKINSSFQVDSTLLQTQNTIEGTFANGELSISSYTTAFKDMLKHNTELSFRNLKLSVKSDTKVLAMDMMIQNIAEASASVGDVSIIIETTSELSENRVNSLIITTLNNNGLSVNSDASAKLAKHTATHKASLTVNKSGLVTSGTTSLNSPLTLSNSFSGALDSSKASLTVETKGQFAGMALDTANSLSASVSSVSLTSKSQVNFAEDLWYSHDISIEAEPYSATVGINNDMKILPVQINNEVKFKAEPYKAELTGNLKLVKDAEELKHTYEIRYADLTAAAKCSTTGRLMGTFMSHNTEMEIAGLGVRINNNAQFNSQAARFDTTFKATAAPFSFDMHGLANGDGEIYLFGKHSGQIFTKVLLKAEPLALAHSHECRISTTHEKNTNIIFEINFDNKVDTLLTPSEQSATVRAKSKINRYVINQEFSAYNNYERIGVEASGSITGIANDNQDVSLSAFLKYDKNTESHVISLPLTESLPAVVETIKDTAVTMAEGLQNFINTDDFVDKIQSLLQNIKEFVTGLNLEEKAVHLKKQLLMFAQDYAISCEDLEASVDKLRTAALKITANLGVLVSKAEEIVKDIIVNGVMSDSIIQTLSEQLDGVDITDMLYAFIEAIEEVIRQLDMISINENYITNYLADLNEAYYVRDSLDQFLSQLKELVANFDKAKFVEDAKNFIASVNIQKFTEQLMTKFPSEEIVKISNTLKQLITELDIIGRCKVFCSNVRDILVTYDIDKRIEALLDKIVHLIKQFRINETVQVFANNVKSFWISFKHMLDEAITYLKTNEVKDVVVELNNILDAFIKSLKSFDYNSFVDEANQKISEYRDELNKLIVTLEIPQILEATRKNMITILSNVSAFLEEVRALRIADVKYALIDFLDKVVLDDFRAFAKKVNEKLADMDIRGEINQALQYVRDMYAHVLVVVNDAFNSIVMAAQEILGDQPLITELKQIIEGMKTAELEIPSFTVPLTDLVLPSVKFSLKQLQEIEIPTMFEIQRFTIMGFHTVPAMRVRLDDINQILMELINFIASLNIGMFFPGAYFEELNLTILPSLPVITLPEITIPDIDFPSLPKLSGKYTLDIPLQIPEIKLPKIPTAVMVPAFGKLYSEIRFSSPIYTFRTTGEIQNSTDNEQMHHFTAFLTSSGNSPHFPILNYNLDSTGRIGVPKLSRVVIAETFRFVHSALTVEHQASVSFYGFSAQASAQTAVKANTEPYKGNIVNKAFLAIEGGMSASFDTSYKHEMDIPLLSLTSEASLTQLTVVVQKDVTVKLTVANVGNVKFSIPDFSDEVTHKSELLYTTNLQTASLTFSGNTDSAVLKIKESFNANSVLLSHVDFSGRIETKSPSIKNSIVVASGRVHLGDMMMEMEATHDAELVGALSGTLANAVNIMVRPLEIIVNFKNRGNTKFSLEESLSAKIDLQGDSALILNPKKQYVNTFGLLRFRQYKYSYNFTIDNNNVEAGIYAALNGETDLEFLNTPISTPELVVPIFDLRIPAIKKFNFYEKSGLTHLLTTTKQTVDADVTFIYQKSRSSPIVALGPVRIPSLGNFNSELSFKSAMVNLNANAEVKGGDDLVIRIAATSTSVFEALKAKLEGTSSLTLKRGLKVANALSLENAHIMGIHDSTMTVNTDNLEAAISITTNAKLNLPILTTEFNHRLQVDTKTQTKTTSTLTIKHTFDFPIINTVGTGNAEHIFKIDAANNFISFESTAKGMVVGKILDTGIVKGAIDHEANLYLNGEGLRSKLKTTGDVIINYRDLKIQFEVNEDMDMEAALTRVYTVLNTICSNEVNIAALNTKGKHVAKAIFDLDLQRSLSVDVEYDLSQPSTFGDLSVFEKTIVDLTLSKQKITYTTKIVSPVYTTNIAVEMDGAPEYKVALKSSAKSPIVFLEYDLDSYISKATDEDQTVITKAFFEHTDFTLELSSVFKLSDPSHTLNVDITSPTFTDVILRYAARRDEVTASVSTPSTGVLGFQVQSEIPSQLKTRLYGRYASAPENDIEILMVRVSTQRDEKIHFQAIFDMEAPREMLNGIQKRMPAIISSTTNFAEKYGILATVEGLRTTIVTTLNEAFTIASTHAPELSQLSILFRNVVVQYQKATQNLLSAAVKFLRETQIRLPGMEASTLPQICQKIKRNIAVVLEQIMKAIADNLDTYVSPVVKSFGKVQITLLTGEVITGEQVHKYVKRNLKSLMNKTVNMVKQLETLDVLLEKLGRNLQEIVVKAQEFVDTIQPDILDTVTFYINTYYTEIITIIRGLIEEANDFLTIDQLNSLIDTCIEYIAFIINECKDILTRILPTESEAMVKFQNGRLEIELPCPFAM